MTLQSPWSGSSSGQLGSRGRSPESAPRRPHTLGLCSGDRCQRPYKRPESPTGPVAWLIELARTLCRKFWNPPTSRQTIGDKVADTEVGILARIALRGQIELGEGQNALDLAQIIEPKMVSSAEGQPNINAPDLGRSVPDLAQEASGSMEEDSRSITQSAQRSAVPAATQGMQGSSVSARPVPCPARHAPGATVEAARVDTQGATKPRDA